MISFLPITKPSSHKIIKGHTCPYKRATFNMKLLANNFVNLVTAATE